MQTKGHYAGGYPVILCGYENPIEVENRVEARRISIEPGASEKEESCQSQPSSNAYLTIAQFQGGRSIIDGAGGVHTLWNRRTLGLSGVTTLQRKGPPAKFDGRTVRLSMRQPLASDICYIPGRSGITKRQEV